MANLPTLKMWCLRIRIKRNDEVRGRYLRRLLINLLRDANIGHVTAWIGMDGFGKRGKAAEYMEGVLINMPYIIEAIDEKSKLEPLLFQIKEIIGDRGIITIQVIGLVS